MDEEIKYNLYLYFMGAPNDLYLIKGMGYDEAYDLAYKWFKAGDNRDFMLVTEDSTPYGIDAIVTEVSSDWIDSL